MLYSSMSLRGKIFFYCGPKGYSWVLIHKKRNFWNRKIFFSESAKMWISRQGPKGCRPLSASNFFWFPWIIWIKIQLLKQNLEGPFWFRARNNIFQILDPAILLIITIELKGSTFLSSLTMFTSCMNENVRKYLFQSVWGHNRSNSGSKHGF